MFVFHAMLHNPVLAGDTYAEAEAGATIIDSLSIAKASDLDIGIVVPDARKAGIVRIGADGEAECDAALVCLTASVTPARFVVQGRPGYAYSVTLPEEIVMSNGEAELHISALTRSASNDDTLDLAGLGTLSIGGSVEVAPGQQAGLYEGQFHVTVEYN